MRAITPPRRQDWERYYLSRVEALRSALLAVLDEDLNTDDQSLREHILGAIHADNVLREQAPL